MVFGKNSIINVKVISQNENETFFFVLMSKPLQVLITHLQQKLSIQFSTFLQSSSGKY